MKFFTIISLFAIAKSVLGDNEFNSVADAVAAGAEVAIECPNWGSVACNPEDDNVKDSLVDLTEDMLLLKHDELYGPGGSAYDDRRRRNLRVSERQLGSIDCSGGAELVCWFIFGRRLLTENRELDDTEVVSATASLKTFLTDVNLPLTAEQDSCAQKFACTMEWVTFDD